MKNFIKCFKLWRKSNSGNDSKQRKNVWHYLAVKKLSVFKTCW